MVPQQLPPGTPPTYDVTYTTVVEHYTGTSFTNQINVDIDSSIGQGNVLYIEYAGLANSFITGGANIIPVSLDVNGDGNASTIITPASYNSGTYPFTINVRTGDPRLGQIVSSTTGNITSSTVNISSSGSNLSTGTAYGKNYYKWEPSSNKTTAGDLDTTGSFASTTPATINIFALSGGGAGGVTARGGGGGAGKALTANSFIINSSTPSGITVGGGGYVGFYGNNEPSDFTNEGFNAGEGNSTVVFGNEIFGGGRGGHTNTSMIGTGTTIAEIMGGSQNSNTYAYCSAPLGNISGNFTGTGGGGYGNGYIFNVNYGAGGGITPTIFGGGGASYPYNYDVCSNGTIEYPVSAEMIDKGILAGFSGGDGGGNGGAGGGGTGSRGSDGSTSGATASGGVGITNNFTGSTITYGIGGQGLGSSTTGGNLPASQFGKGHGGGCMGAKRTGYENSGGGGVVIFQLEGDHNHTVILD